MMRKQSRIILFMAACVAGLMGQVAAFGANTNSVWDLNSINLLKVSKLNAVETNAGTAVFLDDGTFSVTVGTNEFDGTYTNNTKQLTMTLGADSVAGLESNMVDFVVNAADLPPEITITVKSLKVSKIKLSKTGVPEVLTTTLSATASETEGNKTRKKSFSTKSLLTDWVNVSGSF